MIMNATSSFESADRSLRELAAILFLRKKLILSIFTGTVAVSAFLFFYFISPTYEVKSTLIIDTSDLIIPLVDAPPISDLDKLTNFHTQKDILASDMMAAQVVDRLALDKARELSRWELVKLELKALRRPLGEYFGIASWTKPHDPRAASIDAVVSNLTATSKAESRAIVLTYRARNPREAADTLNTLVDVYRAYFHGLINRRAAGITQYLETQIRKVKQDLIRDEQALLEFKQRDTAELEALNGGQDKDPVAPSTPPSITGITDNEIAQNQIKLYLLSLEDEMRKLVVQYSPVDPQVLSVKRRIESYSKLLAKIPERELEHHRLRRSLELNQEMYTFLLKNLEKARMVEAGNSAAMTIITVMQKAVGNDDPVSPKKWANMAICGVFGLIFAMVCALVSDYMDHTVRTVRQVQRVLGLRVLGSLPRITRSARPGFEASRLSLPGNPELEALLSRKDSLRLFNALDHERFLGCGGGPAGLLVASATPGEGASTIALLLAASTAAHRPGMKVLLIDACLSDGSLSRALGVDTTTKGLAACIKGSLKVEDAVVSTAIPGFDVLPAGFDPSGAGLSADAFQRLFESLSRRYDLIVIDAPPARHSRDVSALSKIVRNAILVIQYGGPKREQVQAALDEIHRVDGRVLGAVLNKRTYPLPSWLYEIA